MRVLLNCWLVAMWIWVKSRCRSAFFTRRSYSFNGLIPHTGVIQHIKGRTFVVIEYKPPLNDLWTRKNFLIAFSGKYKVTICEAKRVRHFNTLKETEDAIRLLRG